MPDFKVTIADSNFPNITMSYIITAPDTATASAFLTAQFASAPNISFTLKDGGLEKAGTIRMWGKLTAPEGNLLCDGASYTTASQPALFAEIGYTFGGAGANFNVPDFRQRFPLGKAATGTGSTLGGTGGAIDHTHQVTTGTKVVGIVQLLSTAAPSAETLTSTTNNPPFLSINFIIKT